MSAGGPDVERLDTALRSVLHRLHLPARSIQKEGEVVVDVTLRGETIRVRLLLAQDKQALHLAAACARCSDEGMVGELSTALLSANLFGAGSMGLAFAWSPGDRQFYLGRTLFAEDFDEAHVDANLTRLVLATLEWRRRLRARFGDRLAIPDAER